MAALPIGVPPAADKIRYGRQWCVVRHPLGDIDAAGEPNDVGGWDRGRRTWPFVYLLALGCLQ